MSLSRMSDLIGIKGFYLSFFKARKMNPIPIRVPIFGIIRTYYEIKNLHDNFGTGELRDKKVEIYLSRKQTPCVIDCGVNVGVTVRWWFYLNSQTKVFGIDMIEETQKFTIESLKSIDIDPGRYKAIVAALWSENGKQFKMRIGDPLFGDNSLYLQKK